MLSTYAPFLTCGFGLDFGFEISIPNPGPCLVLCVYRSLPHFLLLSSPRIALSHNYASICSCMAIPFSSVPRFYYHCCSSPLLLIPLCHHLSCFPSTVPRSIFPAKCSILQGPNSSAPLQALDYGKQKTHQLTFTKPLVPTSSSKSRLSLFPMLKLWLRPIKLSIRNG